MGMNENRVHVQYDEVVDVLDVYLDGMLAHRVGTGQDGHIIFEWDDKGEVVGVEILGSSTLYPGMWKRHPDRGSMPPPILEAVDQYVERLAGV